MRTQQTEGLGGLARLGWAPDYCDHLEIEGRCPEAPDEVLLLALDSTITGLSIGDTSPVAGLGTIEVVGTYSAPGPEEADYWFESGRLSTRPPTPPPANMPYQPAPMLGTAEAVERAATGVGYEVLVEAGYQPESAYFECMHELKLIVDLMYEGGLEYMRYSVSDTAEYGDYTRGPRVIDEHVKENMERILAEIQNGSFAREWISENDEGRPRFNRLRAENAAHPIESIGKELRGMMSFLSDTD